MTPSLWHSKGVWVIPSAEDWVQQCWDSESVLYNLRSGDTHYLDCFSSLIYNSLRQANLCGSELESRYNEYLSDQAQANGIASYNAYLVKLMDIGLIRQVPFDH